MEISKETRINANELTNQTTSSSSNNTKLTMLACALGLIIFAVLYAKTVGF
jgi:hypothetical protein